MSAAVVVLCGVLLTPGVIGLVFVLGLLNPDEQPEERESGREDQGLCRLLGVVLPLGWWLALIGLLQLFLTGRPDPVLLFGGPVLARACHSARGIAWSLSRARTRQREHG